MPFSFPDPITSDPWHRHLYAIGVISLYWNQIEDHVNYLLKTIGGPASGLTDFVLSQLGNDAKRELLIKSAQSEWEPEGVASLEHFIKALSTCRENRNIIMHSRYASNEAGEPVMTKLSATGAVRTFSSDLSELTRVASEMDVALWHIYAIIEVGSRRNRRMRSFYERFSQHPLPPWPEKPPLPRKINPLPPQEDRQDDPPPL
jgi:hypothetical protein